MAEGYKDWSAGEILTAADLEDYTVKQSVMRFADSSARTTALSGVLAEGMVSYLKDTDTVEVYDGSAWAAVAGGKILQVVSTTKTDTFTTTSSSFTDLTGLSATITPTSSSSKVLVIVSIVGATENGTSSSRGAYRLIRDSTAIAIGTGVSNRTPSSGIISTRGTNTNNISNSALNFLDSPATTSATTYKIDCLCNAGTLFINRFEGDTDVATIFRPVSTITVMEVSA